MMNCRRQNRNSKEDPEDNLTLIEQKLNEWKNGENVADIEELNTQLSALKLENDIEKQQDSQLMDKLANSNGDILSVKRCH